MPERDGAGEERDYRVEIKIRNARILRRVEAAGFASLAAFAAHHRISYHRLIGLAQMRRPPIDRGGHYRPEILQLCEALNATPEELFNDRQMVAGFSRTRIEREVSENEIASITGNAEALALTDERPEADPLQLLENQEITGMLLAVLSPRERLAIERFYGLGANGAGPITAPRDEDGGMLLDIARDIGVESRERVRQILLGAMRKMRSAAVRRLRIMPADHPAFVADSAAEFYRGIGLEGRERRERLDSENRWIQRYQAARRGKSGN